MKFCLRTEIWSAVESGYILITAVRYFNETRIVEFFNIKLDTLQNNLYSNTTVKLARGEQVPDAVFGDIY